jgi:hypothetical protein
MGKFTIQNFTLKNNFSRGIDHDPRASQSCGEWHVAPSFFEDHSRRFGCGSGGGFSDGFNGTNDDMALSEHLAGTRYFPRKCSRLR